MEHALRLCYQCKRPQHEHTDGQCPQVINNMDKLTISNDARIRAALDKKLERLELAIYVYRTSYATGPLVQAVNDLAGFQFIKEGTPE